jgi:hypothetical protein
LKGQILKKRYAQGWSFARSTSSTAYFLLLQTLDQCGVAFILWKKTFRDSGFRRANKQTLFKRIG